MTHVIPFDKFGAETVRDIGGKGLNLCQLRQQGFEVPDGFCVSVAAFDAMRAANPALDPVMTTWVKGKDDAQNVASAWDAAAFPNALSDAIDAALSAFDDADVFAVRSSAIVEDSAQHSFAGQFDTKLGIKGADDVRAALKAC